MYKTDLMKAFISNQDIDRKNSMTERVKDLTIDTCYAGDTGEWETGIEVKGRWKIVEHYHKGEVQAIEGHKKWVNSCKENPKQEFKDCSDLERG